MQMTYSSVAAWAIDFLRALNMLPDWLRAIIRLVVGRYVRYEFDGLVRELEARGMDTQLEYDTFDGNNESLSGVE